MALENLAVHPGDLKLICFAQAVKQPPRYCFLIGFFPEVKKRYFFPSKPGRHKET